MHIYVYGVMGIVQLFIIYLTINIKNIHDQFIKWEDKVKTNDSLKQKKTFSTSKQTTNDNCFNSPLGLKLCTNKFHSSVSAISPCQINSDIIENTTSQHRGLYNGKKHQLQFHYLLQDHEFHHCRTTIILKKIEHRWHQYGSRFFSTYMYLVHVCGLRSTKCFSVQHLLKNNFSAKLLIIIDF